MISCTGAIEAPLSPHDDAPYASPKGGGFDDPPGTPGVPGSPTGMVGSVVPGGSPIDPTTPGMTSAPLTCTKRSVGTTPLKRLSRVQYTRTVEDIVGIKPDVSSFPADDSTSGYEVALGMSSLLVEAYGESAATIAKAADLKKVLPCDPLKGEDVCAKSFIAQFSRRAFRRATSAAEQTRLLAVYTAGRTASNFDGGVRLVLEAVLQSPSFVYHVEQTDGADASGLLKLTPYALANRLSYLIWGSAPDNALLDAAAAGKLATQEGLLTEARRLITLNPEAARKGFRDFYRQWLSLEQLDSMERDKVRYPEFTRQLAVDLGESLSRQIDSAVWGEAGGLESLLRGDTAFVNANVAPLFGAKSTSSTFVEVGLDATQRKGLLTHPALLSVLAKPNQSDPVLRGKFVRERLFCQPLPPPPPDVATVPPDPKPGLTTRQRFAEHSSNASCAGCHKLMDPIGFGLENYDALGRFRATDEGLAVDSSGEILGSADANGAFKGALELADKLADSAHVQDCVATQYFRFALARNETNADECSLFHAFKGFKSAGGSLSELIMEVVKSDAFRYRDASEVP
jgi:hypothetical protein